jgi:hypothetical protein
VDGFNRWMGSLLLAGVIGGESIVRRAPLKAVSITCSRDLISSAVLTHVQQLGVTSGVRGSTVSQGRQVAGYVWGCDVIRRGA